MVLRWDRKHTLITLTLLFTLFFLFPSSCSTPFTSHPGTSHSLTPSLLVSPSLPLSLSLSPLYLSLLSLSLPPSSLSFFLSVPFSLLSLSLSLSPPLYLSPLPL